MLQEAPRDEEEVHRRTELGLQDEDNGPLEAIAERRGRRVDQTRYPPSAPWRSSPAVLLQPPREQTKGRLRQSRTRFAAPFLALLRWNSAILRLTAEPDHRPRSPARVP